jgi:glucose/arabinose dehydrogenase
MRHLVWVVAALAACGSSNKATKDANGSGSADAAIDAPTLPACANPVSGMTMATRMIGRVSGVAILATSPPNDPRLFVIEQGGRIRIFNNEQLVSTPFLDISSKVTAGGELGLLGLAFHPNYAQNGMFYVWYTATGTSTPYVDVLESYVATSDPNVADAASGSIVLSIPDKYSNHNGGMVEFGSDGYLYVGTGDGGSGGDPDLNGQNTNALLAKILRIDVDHPANGKPYGIPTTNPFANGGGAPEVFMLGVRNPWRWSFDRANGDMWIGDVGQNLVEELDVVHPSAQPGANLGWSMWEADNCYGNYTCTQSGFVFPKAEWWHANTLGHPDSGFRAVIGGQVYRGTCYPDIAGYYFFSDNTASGLERGHLETDDSVTIVDLPGTWPSGPASLHADSRGELYETTTGGYVYHLEAGP